MSEFNFHLFANKYGERLAFYFNPNGRKFIEPFSKIPYTAESLFEDMQTEFPAFSWMSKTKIQSHTDIGLSIGLPAVSTYFDDWCEEYYLKHHFNEIACVMVGDEAIYAELYTLQMNDTEKQLFGELQDYLETYCHKNDMELCIWDEAIEKVQ